MSDVTLFQILLANAAILFGACLQGVAGYGIGTLAAPLLFLISPLFVPAPLILNAILLTLMMLVRNRASLGFRQVRFAIAGDIAGTILAALTLLVLSSQGFQLMFGFLILVAVSLSVAGIRPTLTTPASVMAGAASGYMGTITAVGGPPIALIYQNEKGPLVRANMSAFFLFASCASLVALFFSGYVGLTELQLFVVTFPGTLAGFLVSGPLINRLPFHALRPIILGIAALAGIAALVRGIVTW
ncbi:sulfite exporter TauE/SafE family protein [Marinobacter sp.]|uniref:sulfite exporter TauE/SafE family protein n=1 Tax=Marinobacter sp. TaxID=50741 RepID=UPI00384B34BD